MPQINLLMLHKSFNSKGIMRLAHRRILVVEALEARLFLSGSVSPADVSSVTVFTELPSVYVTPPPGFIAPPNGLDSLPNPVPVQGDAAPATPPGFVSPPNGLAPLPNPLPVEGSQTTFYTDLPPVYVTPPPGFVAPPNGLDPLPNPLPASGIPITIYTQEPPVIEQLPPNIVAPNSPVVPFKTSVAAVSSADPGHLSAASGGSGLFNTGAVITADAIFASTDSILD
ncbi:MAG: hypothetical protein ABSG31_06895 [Tepidisphaeraceae bacterium]|jgi:hypothetical protein